MDPSDFKTAVERYKAELLRLAVRSGRPENAVGTPYTPPDGENANVNPPEAGEGNDPLQSFSPETDTFAQFQRLNRKTGFLRVQAFAGPQAVPVEGASVIVTHDFTDGVRRFASGRTDESGILDGIVLPAPDTEAAQAPGGVMPYALYDIRVSHPDYRTEIYRQVPVFPGVKSIQPVRFLSDHTGG